MGHTRLGTIPTLRKWADIVATFVSDSSAPLSVESTDDVARRTLDAAEPALRHAMDDPGLAQAFFLLARLVLAARESEWKSALGQVGVQLPHDASLFDLTSELHASVDALVAEQGQASDVSEMAQGALGEALVKLVAPRADTLFGSREEDLHRALREFSTKKGFGELGQHFFGHFLARFMNSYLSRITAGETGGGTLRQVGELSRFNVQLNNHCIESAKIVRDFCGEWYSKTEHFSGIDTDNSRRFVAVAMAKLSAEVRRQGVHR